VILGLATLVFNAWRGGSWIARLLLLWLIVPFALLSLSTSKYVHYTYPFLPPLALGAGAAAEALVRVTRRIVARVLAVLPRRPERLERI
jgi:4-amino-4-deoxy-L-arabinose transferase-like glycosyltransferase